MFHIRKTCLTLCVYGFFAALSKFALVDAKSSKAVQVGDLSIDVSGKSGAIKVKRINLGKKKSKQSSVQISLDALREIDVDGNIVGQKGKEKHSLESFSSKDFTFGVDEFDYTVVTPVTTTNVTNSTNTTNTNSTTTNTTVTEYINTTATGAKVSFSTTLDNGSEVGVETVLISGAGEVGTLTEKWSVLPGDMKFNIDLSNWEWCDPCSDGTGEFIDIDIEIKGSKAKPSPKHKKGGPKHDKNKTWELGDGATLDLSDEVFLDGNWTSMPEGFPRLVIKNEKQLYTFRFPKFNDTVFYDPIVSFDPFFEGVTDSANAIFATSVSFIALIAGVASYILV